MRRVIYCLVMVGLLAALIVGASPPKVSSAPPLKKAWEWPKTTQRIATYATSASDYIVSMAWTPVHGEQTGVKWRLMAESSTPTISRWMKAGEIDFWSTMDKTEAEAIYTVLGHATREGGPWPLRLVWVNNVGNSSWFVRGDSRIKTVHDIKPGTTYALWAASVTMNNLYNWFRDYVGMTKEELVAVPVGSMNAGVRAVGDGKVDIGFCSMVSSVMYEVSARPLGIRVLEIPEDREAEKRALPNYPLTMLGKMDVGIKEAHGLRMSLGYRTYCTRADTDEQFIYHLCKWFDENLDAYKGKHKLCEYMGIKYLISNLDRAFLPYHEGAIRYLREIGVWTAAHDARQTYNVWLENEYIEGYEHVKVMADEKGIKIDPRNKEWLELWENYKKKNLRPYKVMDDEEVKAALKTIKK